VKGSWRKGRCCSAALPLSPVLPGRTRGESIKRGAEERMEERKACANLGRSFGQGMSISKPSGKVDDVSLNPAQPQTNYCSSLFLPSSIPLPSLFRPSSVPLPSLFLLWKVSTDDGENKERRACRTRATLCLRL
jgi:hypothetical protein